MSTSKNVSKHYVWQIIVVQILLSVLVSCSGYPDDVQKALVLAKQNRSELEKVLDHYKNNDQEKYRAACFLIANMRYHTSREQISLPAEYHHFFSLLDSAYHAMFPGWSSDSILQVTPRVYDSLRRDLGHRFEKLPPSVHSKNSIGDLKRIQSDFLLKHIDHAFDSWRNDPLIQGMNFDDFKEFVLPYRTTDEELLMNRTALRAQWMPIVNKEGFTDIHKPINRYKSFVGKCRWLTKFAHPTSHLAVYDLILPKFSKNCHNLTNWSIQILRSCGIPAVYEYTPQWKDRPSRHFWAVSPDSNGIWQPYTTPDNNLRENWESDLQMASKVYRKTFGANKESPYFLADSSEYIPHELISPVIQDQTFRYHQTITLRIPITVSIKTKLAYLCLFQGDKLNAVAWGKIDHRKKEAVFEQVPLHTVFVPVFYEKNGKEYPFGTPFINPTALYRY